MKKLVFSSLNIDKTYHLDRFPHPGETLSARDYSSSPGGKGFNLTMAMAKAGDTLCFAGAIGPDGQEFERIFEEYGVDASFLHHSQRPCGHAVIQVDSSGQNCIIIVKGANGDISREYMDHVLGHFTAGDVIILQNEIEQIDYLLEKSHEKSLQIAFNPSPINAAVERCDLSLVDYLFINEGEGETLSGVTGDAAILRTLHERWPGQLIVLTLGHRGAACILPDGRIETCGVYDVRSVDTTAAGDTFAGYFLAEYLREKDVHRALCIAAVASGIAVSKRGAAVSIPCREEVLAADFTRLTALSL